jgi:hypothetical protein
MDRQTTFDQLLRKNLPLNALGEKELRLLLDLVKVFMATEDFIQIFRTR